MREDNLILKNPLVSVLASIIMGSLVYASDFNSGYIIVSLVIFLLISLLGGYKSTACIFLFFILSIGNNFFYYSIPFVPEGNYSVRITGKCFEEYKGIYKGRRILIKENYLKLNVGSRYLIRGEFMPDSDKSQGTAGIIYQEGCSYEFKDMVSYLYKYKEKVYEEIKKYSDKETAAMISAISFGYTDELSSEQKNDMKYWGLIHIVSVSGFHLAMIYKILEKTAGYKAALVVCAFYVVFTGSSSPALRAFIMIIVLKMGEKFFREYNPISALAFSGILICLTTPYSPLDLGFQLSYLATAGIILFNNRLNKYFHALPKYIRESLAISISPQILSLPVAGISIGGISLNSMLTNLILMPFFSLIVILGNLLLITYEWRGLFLVIVRISYMITILINRLLSILKYISLPIVNTEKEIIYFYIICLGCFYFVKEGFEQFKYFPAFITIPLIICIYSPLVKINIEKGRELRVSYRGRINRYNLFNNKIIENDIYRDKIPLNSSGDCMFVRGNNLCIKLHSNDVYCFSMTKSTEKCGIITFKEEEIIFVLGQMIIRF
ncbi:MAG: ComEC/Rec2 family competence protein [Clostridiaceae bacterium]